MTKRKAQPGDYHYFRLYDNFFDKKEVRVLESLENGMMYTIVLLKLYAISAEYNGLLTIDGKKPHTAKTISEKIGMSEELVEESLGVFINFNLITERENGFYDIPELIINTGISNPAADTRRRNRRKKQRLEEGR